MVNNADPSGGTSGAARMPTPAGVALALGSGLLLDLAFPGVGWWPLAPVALAGFLTAVHGRSVRGGALLGMVFGLAFFVPHVAWSGIYVGPMPWLALATLQALYIGAFGAVAVLGLRASRRMAPRALILGGLWVGQEALRSRTPFGGFPWGRLAFSQADAPTVGLAALGGAPLVSFAVAAAGALLAHAALSALPAGRRQRPVLTGTGSAALATLVMAVGAAVPGPGGATGSIDVAAVQGNVPRAGLDFNAERRAVLDNHAQATWDLARAVSDGRARPPDLVVWPENSSDIDPLRNPDAAQVISDVVEAIGVPVLLGAVLAEPADQLSNTSIVWEPGTGAGQQYVKRRPVPFAEYVPYRSFFRRITDKVDLVRRDFVAGTGPNVLTVGPATVGTAICFEVAFDDLLREAVRGGADLLVVQTNNATFGRTDESVQQLAMSRLRAVELGRSVVHISTVGVSALITPAGDMVEVSDHFTSETLMASLPLRDGLTVAARVGTWPEGLLVLVGLVGAALGVRAGRGHRPAARERGSADPTVRRREVLLHAVGTMVLAAGCSGPAERPQAEAAPATPPARLLGPAEFAAAVDRDDRFLLNVHTPDEGSIPGTDGAVPFDQLEDRAAELPADTGTPLAVYCRTGGMSADAVKTLAGMGYQDLVELDGGMVAWERAGRQLLRPGARDDELRQLDGSEDR